MRRLLFSLLLVSNFLLAIDSVKDLEDACAKENAEACLKVGAMYYDGDGIERDRKKGIKYLRAACICGSKIACKIIEKID